MRNIIKAMNNAVCMGLVCYGPSLRWAEFALADFVLGRVCNGPSLLWAEMSLFYRFERSHERSLQMPPVSNYDVIKSKLSHTKTLIIWI